MLVINGCQWAHDWEVGGEDPVILLVGVIL